jgi:DNA repair protein RadA
LTDLPQIDSELYQKLKEKGLDQPLLFAVATEEQLMDCGLSDTEAQELLRSVRDMIDVTFETPREFAGRVYNLDKISTGSRYLDDLMDRGVETTKLTEFFGPASSGKTQLCLQLAVNVQLPEGKGGVESGAVYVDTEGSFSPKRIREMAEARELAPKEAMRRIHYARINTVDALFEIVRKAERFLEDGSAKILILDNFAAPFSTKFDRSEIQEKQVSRQKLLFRLLTYAEVHRVAVVLTNRVYSIPDDIADESFYPLGGMVVDRSVHKKIMLRNQREGKFLARDSRSDEETIFKIEEKGVGDL